MPPAPSLSAPSPVYANVPISKPLAPALYANAPSFNFPPTARPPEQSAFGWQPSAPQRGTPSVWQPPLFLPKQPTSSYGAAPQPTLAPYLSAPPPPPRTQAYAYQQSVRRAPVLRCADTYCVFFRAPSGATTSNGSAPDTSSLDSSSPAAPFRRPWRRQCSWKRPRRHRRRLTRWTW